MALGLGQFSGQFSSPAGDAGVADWQELSGLDPSSPFVAGPAVGGYSDPGDTGLVHMAAGNQGAGDDTLMRHWSNLLDWRNSTMPYLLLVALFFLGFVHLSVAGKVGR